MSIVYSDLNNACPKDHYPLPQIDQKDSNLNFSLMPTKAITKSRCTGKTRKRQLSSSTGARSITRKCYSALRMPVNVDDIVIKIHNETTLLQDIEETLQTLAQAQMKLNSGKHTFGVEKSQFLGYQITKDGIWTKPGQHPGMSGLWGPYNIKGVQEINERLTTLGRFIARSTEKTLPLFHTLKGCVEKNHFKWTKEACAAL
uniref:Reverse transcriptase/retrotransposon-derived protein RNase H-like domain-containing protein n=1 Tax=Lactuca sativa TaxID=4236 RepID=A0A9R1WY72_LACSA|nr:hypothetical protein LSAT_V11C800393880 [Lactuca sativa]